MTAEFLLHHSFLSAGDGSCGFLSAEVGPSPVARPAQLRQSPLFSNFKESSQMDAHLLNLYIYGTETK